MFVDELTYSFANILTHTHVCITHPLVVHLCCTYVNTSHRMLGKKERNSKPSQSNLFKLEIYVLCAQLNAIFNAGQKEYNNNNSSNNNNNMNIHNKNGL